MPTAAPTATAIVPTPTGQPAPSRHLVILYTNDEHGWIEATKTSGGAAGLMGLWRDKEGCAPGGNCLILSGGDMWTGPAISTWFKGESMVEVMNAMGYAAAAVGNHEFDFGLAVLRARQAQMAFPLLSANLHARDGSTASIVADGTVKPYIIREINGIRVGIIGLSSQETPQTTMPSNVADFAFTPYDEALKAVAPQARADGAELLVVVGHLCSAELSALIPTAAGLGITVLTGGHCHTQQTSRVVNGLALLQTGSFLDAYARVDIDLDATTSRVRDITAKLRDNIGGKPDAAIAALVDTWRDKTDQALSQVIGYAKSEIARQSDAMYNMLTDAWLKAYPTADVALCNRGSFRQSIPAGEITLKTIVGVLPFDNVLMDVELTGAQLIENIECCNPAVGGMTTRGGFKLADGTPVDPDRTYHVLTNDYMYAGGDQFKLKDYDPDAYNTATDWRQPVIDWLLSLHTTEQDPLENYLDDQAR